MKNFIYTCLYMFLHVFVYTQIGHLWTYLDNSDSCLVLCTQFPWKNRSDREFLLRYLPFYRFVIPKCYMLYEGHFKCSKLYNDRLIFWNHVLNKFFFVSFTAIYLLTRLTKQNFLFNQLICIISVLRNKTPPFLPRNVNTYKIV